MKNIKRSILAMLLVIVLVASSIVPVSAASSQPDEYSKTYNSGERHVVCTTLDGTSASDYYTGSYTYDRLEDLSSSSLLTTLRGLMKSTHKRISTYNDCRDMAIKTDCENEDGRVVLIYTSYSATRSQYNGWNREHVWPKSLGGNNTTGGGADLHHIRPSDASVNSSRGNKKYGDAGSNPTEKYGSNPATGYLGGYYNSTYFEPLDEVKGDVARICLYVWVRWGSEWGADYITEVFQSVDVLLEWCELDPVDTWEMGRNEVVEAYQGNRNVFIDYPELAWLLFDKEIPDDMVTPSGEAKGGNGGSVGDPDCPHTLTEVKNVKQPTCTANGYTGDTCCTACGFKVSEGTSISALGHEWSQWTATDDGKNMIRTCSVCSATETKEAQICSHSFTTVKNKEPATCGESGNTGDVCCAKCGEIIVPGQIIPSTGDHEWGDMIITSAPTPDSDGEATTSCLGCGMIRTVTLRHQTEGEQIIVALNWSLVYAILAEMLYRA